MYLRIFFFCFTIAIIDYTESAIGITPDKNALGFYFFSADNPSKGIKTDISNHTSISKISFSPEKKTYFIIHGWRSSVATPTVANIKTTLLEEHDINVFIVDWDGIAYEIYPVALMKVKKLGAVLGSLINNMVTVGGLELKRTTFVGFSLGAHMAGAAGRELEGQIDVIVGLDPAGVGYYLQSLTPKLSPSSANFVHVIHTNGRGLGSMKNMGHADYYPNGGDSQPMCGIFNIRCSHSIALQFYVESLKGTRNFTAHLCNSYRTFKKGNCKNEKSSKMGGYHIDKTASGSYYLKTNLESPYAIN